MDGIAHFLAAIHFCGINIFILFQVGAANYRGSVDLFCSGNRIMDFVSRVALYNNTAFTKSKRVKASSFNSICNRNGADMR
jgi:hypothetical protein